MNRERSTTLMAATENRHPGMGTTLDVYLSLMQTTQKESCNKACRNLGGRVIVTLRVESRHTVIDAADGEQGQTICSS